MCLGQCLAWEANNKHQLLCFPKRCFEEKPALALNSNLFLKEHTEMAVPVSSPAPNSSQQGSKGPQGAK